MTRRTPRSFIPAAKSSRFSIFVNGICQNEFAVDRVRHSAFESPAIMYVSGRNRLTRSMSDSTRAILEDELEISTGKVFIGLI